MNYSTVKELIEQGYSRESIRTLDAYAISDDAEWIQEACVLIDTDDRSISEYFADLADECWLADCSETVKNYFDYDAFERDLFLAGDYSKLEHKGHAILICNH